METRQRVQIRVFIPPACGAVSRELVLSCSTGQPNKVSFVAQTGFEPALSGLKVQEPDQLAYCALVGGLGIEPKPAAYQTAVQTSTPSPGRRGGIRTHRHEGLSFVGMPSSRHSPKTTTNVGSKGTFVVLIAPGPRFELRPTGSEPDVLPLHHPGMDRAGRGGLEPPRRGSKPRGLPLADLPSVRRMAPLCDLTDSNRRLPGFNRALFQLS